LCDGAWHGDAADGQQVVDREVQANAEHEEDDADFGQLRSEARIGDESRRERSDRHSGEEVAEDRRQSKAYGEKPEQKREGQSTRYSSNQSGFVGHERKMDESGCPRDCWPRLTMHDSIGSSSNG
jgi:hypothetical protein